MKRWVRRIALGLAAVVVVVIVAGTIYEFAGRRAAVAAYPLEGTLVDIGGRRIALDCRGAGTPVVVFESGLDLAGSLAWSAVHDSIATTTRACAYSRAGIMWSDPPDQPQSGKRIAEDLHAVLSAAGEPAPYVLVGHSLGGPYIVIFTKYFGEDVAGLVFVDASHPDQMERIKAYGIKEPSLTIPRLASALAWTGVVRAVVSGWDTTGTPEQARMKTAANAWAPLSLRAMLQEQAALKETVAEAGSLRDLGARPLFVITAMAPFPAEALTTLGITAEQGERFQQDWKAMHEEEASWSSRSQHEIVPDATHYIQFDRPDVVIRAVRAVVDSVRATP